MPLIKSSSDAAFKTNLKAELGAGKPRDQALAIAYRVKRQGRAMGGPSPASWQTRKEAGAMTHSGPIMSAVPGRTDRHNMNVNPGSYVFPADFVSHLGQNNSMAGMAVLNHMFGKSGPYGSPTMGIKHGQGAPRPPKAAKFAKGGGSDASGPPVPICTGGGEHVLEPEIVLEIGGGDLSRGHKILDHWVMETRKKHIKTLKALPPPAKA